MTHELSAPVDTVGLLKLTRVKVAAAEVVLPVESVRTTSYSFPLTADDALIEYVGDVAPLMALKLTPPSVETFHCIEVAPDALTLKGTVSPDAAMTDAGWLEMVGAETLRVATVVVTVVPEALNWARYLYPFIPDVAVVE